MIFGLFPSFCGTITTFLPLLVGPDSRLSHAQHFSPHSEGKMMKMVDLLKKKLYFSRKGFSGDFPVNWWQWKCFWLLIRSEAWLAPEPDWSLMKVQTAEITEACWEFSEGWWVVAVWASQECPRFGHGLFPLRHTTSSHCATTEASFSAIKQIGAISV